MHATLTILAQASANNPTPIGGDGQWLAWGIILLAIALALFILEAFVPSGGLLGILSGVMATLGVLFLFRFDTTYGLIAAIATIIAAPFAVGFILKIWPNTPVGKWLILKEHQPSPDEVAADSVEKALPIAVGDTGQALTPLRPVGTCMINGRREECMAQRGSIESGTQVRVVTTDGPEVYVTPVS